MPKRKTEEQKRETALTKKFLLNVIEEKRQQIVSMQQSWRIKTINIDGIKKEVPVIPKIQEIRRRGLKYLNSLAHSVENTQQRVKTKMEDIIRKNNLKLSENGQRDRIVRPSGLVYETNIPLPDPILGVMAWKEMLQNQRPDQIIKVVVEKTDQTQEQMNLEDFIDFIEEYETSFNKAKSISSYSIGFGGGCATKNDAQIIHFEINDWHFTCKTVVTKDNDCIFAVLSKFAGKKKTGKVVRKDLGFELGALIQVEDLQKLANYFNVNILLYFCDGEQVRQVDLKCEQKTEIVAIVLLYKNHYYYVQKVVTPQLFSRQTKFDQYLTKTVLKADSSNFEIKKENEFADFNEIAQYIVESDKHIFIHGSGGVGKSYLCELVRQLYDQHNKRLTITSSTGKSAIQINGVTIHHHLAKNKKDGFKYDVVIDEISMVAGDLFDSIIQAQERGDVRIILVGDLKQLAPVKLFENGGYFFESALYERIHDNMTRIDLTEVKRTNDPEFIKIQQRLRNCDYDQEVYDYLQRVTIPEFYIDDSEIKPQADEIIMACTNKIVDRHNGEYLHQFILNGAQSLEFNQVQKIDMESLRDAFNNDEDQMKQFIAKNTLQYRLANKKQIFYVGERVMLRCNKIKSGLCNGSIGTIQCFDQEKHLVTVLFDNGKQCEIEPVIKYKAGSAILYSEKLPLICARAMTIHKAQGLTISSKVFLDLQYVFESQMIYVGISRVTDFNLLRINKLPKLDYLQTSDKLRPNPIIDEYLDQNIFESQAFKMLIDDHRKQMYISKHQALDLIDQNTMYFDFETAEINKNGIIRHQPYYNHITYYKDKNLVDQMTFKDFGQYACDDVAQETFNYVMNIVKTYEEEYTMIKGLQDRKLTSRKKKLIPTIVSFNGSGFDLYFLLEKLLATSGFSSQYEVKTTFKGNNLVIFALQSQKCKTIVLRSFDICQITNSTLDSALKSFCPQIAQKIDFKREIIYLAKHRYNNPEILNGQIHRVSSEQIVKIVDSKTLQFINKGGVQKECGWQIEEQDLTRLKQLQLDPNNFQRCYQTTVYKDINLKEQLDEYAQNDTEVLQPLLHAIDKICFDQLGCSIQNFNTAGQVCWYGFMQNVPKELLAENRYDQNRHDKLRKINGNLKTHLFACELDEQQFCLESIIGGKTCPRQKTLEPILDPKTNQFIGYVYLDISGMYCDLMLTFDYPFGSKRWLRQDEMKLLLEQLQTQVPTHDITKLIKIKDAVLKLLEDKFIHLFIARVDIEENPISVEPVITYKHKLGGTDDKPIYKSMYTNQRRIQTLTSIDILTILLKGGKIHDVQKCLVFEKKGAILKDWMIKCLDIKNEGKRKKLPAMTSFGKLLANGTYGQTQKQDRHSVTLFVNDTWDSDSFLDKYKLKNIFITDSDTDIIIGSKLVNKEEYVTSRCSYIGSFVLAYSRLIIQDICQHLNPEQDPEKQPLYGDTDSLLCREDLVRERLIPAAYVQARSGKLADELADTLEKQFWFPKSQPKYYNKRSKQLTNKDDPEAEPDEQTWNEICDQSNYKFVTVTKGTFVQPKTIAILYQDPDQPDDWHEKIRAKGIPLNSKYNENGECMSYKLFMDLFVKAQKNQDIIDEQIQFKISELKQETVDEETKTKIKKSVLKTVQRGEQLELPNGIKVLTPNLINGQYNQFGEQCKNVKKNEALYKIVPNQMTRRIFNTEYKGRVVSKKNNNIYLPFGHPDTI